MTTLEFTVLDGDRFPIVMVRRSKVVSGGIEAMIADFEVLLDCHRPFVLSMAGDRDEEPSHEDQKRWMLWLKENRERLASSCRGVVSLADKASDMALQQKQAAGMQAMLGIPVKIVENADEAEIFAAERMRS